MTFKQCLTAICCAVLIGSEASGQETDGITYEMMGGVYYAYHPDTAAGQTPPPDGYAPFYVSHFGRHGSRWLPSDSRYANVLSQFADTTNLTELGKDVRRRLLLVWQDVEGRGGDLTDIGAEQQRGIAERMYARWPEVFSGEGEINARSSVVGRCVMSMNAFLLRLQALNPRLVIRATANKRDMPVIAYSSPEEDSLIAATPRIIHTSPARLMSSLFMDTTAIEQPIDLLSELHCIASDMQDAGIGVSLYDIFTPDEMRAVYDASNLNMWTCNSRNPASGDIPVRSAESLWRDFVEAADMAIAKGQPCATLRFGHDTSLYRLLTLLGLYQDEMRMDRIIPMGANFFIVFYRSANPAKPVLVKLLHNEREITLPTLPTAGPYYKWDDVKRIYELK